MKRLTTIFVFFAIICLSEQRLRKIEDQWYVTVSYGLKKSDGSTFLKLAQIALEEKGSYEEKMEILEGKMMRDFEEKDRFWHCGYGYFPEQYYSGHAGKKITIRNRQGNQTIFCYLSVDKF